MKNESKACTSPDIQLITAASTITAEDAAFPRLIKAVRVKPTISFDAIGFERRVTFGDPRNSPTSHTYVYATLAQAREGSISDETGTRGRIA